MGAAQNNRTLYNSYIYLMSFKFGVLLYLFDQYACAIFHCVTLYSCSEQSALIGIDGFCTWCLVTDKMCFVCVLLGVVITQHSLTIENGLTLLTPEN